MWIADNTQSNMLKNVAKLLDLPLKTPEEVDKIVEYMGYIEPT